MNKKIIIGVVVALVFLAGLSGWWYFKKSDNTNPVANDDRGGMMQENTTQTKSGSWKDLLADSVSQKCSIDYTTDGTAATGTVYVGGGRMRSDMYTNVDGKEQSLHMVVVDHKMNYWMDGQTAGYMMTLGDITPTGEVQPKPNEKQNTFDLNQDINYKCEPWVVENDVFSLPSDVTFTDINAMMKASTSTASQCAACANLSGDQKTQCLTVLKCN